MSEYTFLPGISLPPFSDFFSKDDADTDTMRQPKQSLRLQSKQSFQSGLKAAVHSKPTRRRSSIIQQNNTKLAEPKKKKMSKRRRRGAPKSNNLHLIERSRLKAAFKASLSSVYEDVSLEATVRHANH
jgi:hypothetical protein